MMSHESTLLLIAFYWVKPNSATIWNLRPNHGPQKTIVVNDKISNRSQGWGVTGAHAYRSGPMDRYEAFSRELGLSGTASD
jgi:hypothetical protein